MAILLVRADRDWKGTWETLGDEGKDRGKEKGADRFASVFAVIFTLICPGVREGRDRLLAISLVRSDRGWKGTWETLGDEGKD